MSDDSLDGIRKTYLDLFERGHRVEVLKVDNPYRPDRNCRYRPLPGNKYVLITVGVTNTDVAPVVASFSDFSVECERSRRYRPISIPEIEDDFGAARCPGPGMTEVGSLLFEIPLIAEKIVLRESIDGIEREVKMPEIADETVA